MILLSTAFGGYLAGLILAAVQPAGPVIWIRIAALVWLMIWGAVWLLYEPRDPST